MLSWKITRKPWFWIAHSIFFILCVSYTWKNFDRAFPFVDLAVKMDRSAALKDAARLATAHHWFPQGKYQEAVTFDVESSTQNFIELEAGGPKALRQVLKDGVFAIYSWRVRHFAEGQTNETQVRFMPDGRPYGFSEKLSEEDPGAVLPAEEARLIAEKSAIFDWGMDLKPYHLIEKSSEIRKSKRVDHSFIYERDDLHVGEGKYRLTLEVSGDRLTEISPTIKVPEAFYRRYATLRSANGTIAQLAGAAVVLLYGLGLCGFGLFVLARGGWVQWRAPLVVAGVISVLHFADELNRLPLEWMDYDTAISNMAFTVRHITGALLGSLFDFVMVIIPLIAGESLSRKAFPNQPQLWRVFSREAASSRQVLGRVLGAYLFVGVHFAWVVWIYQVGSQRLGWWNPSELLFHPDELATYFPWLTSIANSLHAGIWEECLFRAVPLAGAALLGSRFGKRGAWIAAAFVLQAVIFGSAHASYPTQPSYARLVELLVPSSIFGGVYLAFGLLPGILMHYTYDVTLFAMPLFLSSGRTAQVSRVIVIALSGLPLWIPLISRLRAGAPRELAEALYNRAWKPKSPDVSRARDEIAPATPLSLGLRKGLIGSGALALCLAIGLGSNRTDAPGLKLSRTEAIQRAHEVLSRQGVNLGPEWQALARVESSPDEEDDFIWRTAGEVVYHRLLGTYLEPPLWKIRFVRFEGDLIERAEERQVFIFGSGEVERVRHELPESRPGKILDEAAARVIATRELSERYAVRPVAGQVDEISSQQTQLPARRDWVFTWRDSTQALKQGEARVAVRISGDEVVGYRRYIHVPEDWLRAERSRKTTMGVLRTLGGGLFALLGLWMGFLAARGWVRGQFAGKVFISAFLAVLASSALLRFNEFQEGMAQFSTAQPWSTQVLGEVVSDVLLSLMIALISALCLGRVRALTEQESGMGSASGLEDVPAFGPWLGYSCGAWVSALGALSVWFSRGQHPVWASVGAAGAVVPWLESMQGVVAYAGGTAFLMLLIPWIRQHFRNFASRAVVFGLLGLAMGAFITESSLLEWGGAGAVAAFAFVAVYELIARTSVSVVIPFMASAMILRAARTVAIDAFPGAVAYGTLLAAGIAVGSWFWYRSAK